MTFKINFEHQDGTEDSFVVSGKTIQEIREQTDLELAKRMGKNPWSEELS